MCHARPHVGHQIHDGKQLIGQPGDDGTAAGGGGVLAAADDVLARKQPVAPAETAHGVEEAEVEDRCFGALVHVFLRCRTIHGRRMTGATKLSHPHRPRPLTHIRKKVAMRLGSVAAEIHQDVRQRVGGHGDLEQGVEQRDDAVVGAGLAAETAGFVFGGGVVSFVDDTAREHGLVGDAEDEGAVGGVVGGAGARPHGFHARLDGGHGGEKEVEGGDAGGTAAAGVRGRASVGGDGGEEGGGAEDKGRGVGDHVDVGEDEAGFGRGGV